MITEYIRYRIDADRANAFVADYTSAAKSLDASEYCLGYDLARSVETPESFILRIIWTSADDHLGKFRKSAEFGAFLGAIRNYVPDIVEMGHYAETGVTRAPSVRA